MHCLPVANLWTLFVLYPGTTLAGRKRSRRSSTAFTGFLRPGEAHCRSLGFARDDKGRAVTGLKFRESDGTEELPIRLADFQVINHSPLVIPSEAEGSAVRLARTQKSRESSEGPAVSLTLPRGAWYGGYSTAYQLADERSGQRFVEGQMKTALGAGIRLQFFGEAVEQ